MKPQVTPRIAAKGRATSGSAAVSPEKCSSSARTTSTASAAPPAISHTITPAAVMPAASTFPRGRVRRMDSSAITGRLVPSASAQSDDSPVTHKSVRMSPDAIKSARIPRETALRNSFGRADTSSPCLEEINQLRPAVRAGAVALLRVFCFHRHHFRQQTLRHFGRFSHSRTAAYTPRRGTARSCRFSARKATKP